MQYSVPRTISFYNAMHNKDKSINNVINEECIKCKFKKDQQNCSDAILQKKRHLNAPKNTGGYMLCITIYNVQLIP